ncbi:uncharacterized protein LOC131957826, partial [Physella acuta]|uniref:uncharacterized protein LOC131957826 n=1 Tax=Physella acuta TaxID=109671 RepID=UPI0027DBDE87
VTSDPVGEDNPKRLSNNVRFEVTSRWVQNLTFKLVAYSGGRVLNTLESEADTSLNCSSNVSTTFMYINERRHYENPSGVRLVNIHVFATQGPSSNPAQCNRPLCHNFTVVYHFPPESVNVIIHSTSHREDQPVTISCSTTDGYPEVTDFGIRILDMYSRLPLLYVPNKIFQMEKALRGRYMCEAISYPFGRRLVVPSERIITIRPAHRRPREGTEPERPREGAEPETVTETDPTIPPSTNLPEVTVNNFTYPSSTETSWWGDDIDANPKVNTETTKPSSTFNTVRAGWINSGANDSRAGSRNSWDHDNLADTQKGAHTEMRPMLLNSIDAGSSGCQASRPALAALFILLMALVGF